MINIKEIKKLNHNKNAHMNNPSYKYKEFLQNFSDTFNDPFFIINNDLISIFWNKASEKLIGIPIKEATGKSLYDIFPNLKGTKEERLFLKTIETQKSQSCITEYKIGNKNSIFEIKAIPLGDNVSVLLQNKSDEKQAENLQKLETLILERLNRGGELINIIHEVILYIKTFNGFDAVGIRLNEYEDYPYYLSEGFPPKFLETENNLCAKDKDGNLIFDKKGNVVLECMCGIVIKGKTDSSLHFFTEKGSFWTNSTTEFLKNTTEKERKTKTRNQCNIYGYESVALIPLKSDGKIFGLLQLNDMRKNIFKYDLIRIFEGIAASIGTALAREKAIQDLKISEQRYSLAQNMANIGSWDWDILTSKLIWSENIEPMFGFKKGQFKGTYEAFLDCIHPQDRDFVINSVNDCLENKNYYEIEHRILWPNGTVRWLLERGDVIRDKNNKPIRMLGMVQDITDKKEIEKDLEDRRDLLEKMVKEKTSELENSNKKLLEEIIERKRAEEYSNRTKQNLRNIIDSASELIISFDMNNRISIWNKTAENVTGYKEIEVLNRSIKKLDVFANKDEILEQIKNICKQKKSKFTDIILKTKDNEKIVIRVYGTEIKSLNKECVGTLLIGNDITKEIELHKKLLEGNSYLIKDKNNKSAIDLIIDLVMEHHKGLIVARGNPAYIKRLIPEIKNLKIVLLTRETHKGYTVISDLINLEKNIKDFGKKNKNTIILLDGVHYLITRFSFEKFIETLYNITDAVTKNKSIFFIRIDPSTVDSNQMAVFENELLILPSQTTDDLVIEDDSFDILKYLFEQNQINAIVSFKKIIEKFKITYVTAASKLNNLEKIGLIFTKKQGKLRAIFVTEKGKMLINRRKTV